MTKRTLDLRRTMLLGAVLAIGLLLTANTVRAQTPPFELPPPPAGGDNALNQLWKGVVSGIGQEFGEVVAGWALSAIGIAGSADQEIADLTEIINLLEQVDAELSQIAIDLENLACAEATNATELNAAIKIIGGLYDRYTMFVQDYHDARTIPEWADMQQWLEDIMDPENGVQANLIAMQTALAQPAGTSVIDECVKFIVDEYQNGDGPKKAVFDWTGDKNAPGVYDLVQQLTDYYYLYQTWAAVLLVEGYHVQACVDSSGATPTPGDDRNCTFGQAGQVTPQTGVTSNTPFNLCVKPANNQIAAQCLNAQLSLTNTNNNGAYDGLRQQLIAAGAPYSNALLGKVMAQVPQSKADVVYPRSLEDITNNMTTGGQKGWQCGAAPLTSAAPCGSTVTAWSNPFVFLWTYGTVTDASGKVLFGGYPIWNYGYSSSDPDGGDEGANLATLLANYNAKTAGDTSGTLGDWMASVGFIDNADPTKGPLGNPRFKIILTGQDYKIKGSDESAVCLMDTNISRSSSGQPWCMGVSGATDNVDSLLQEIDEFPCGEGCTAVEYEAASFTAASTAPGFYTANVTVEFGIEATYSWNTSPGWLASVNSQQSKYWNFHWPSFQVQNLPSDWCTDTWEGTPPQDAKNPGGVLTMCGPDLDAWLELELAKPPVSPSMASADTTLYRADRHRNDGAGPVLQIAGAGERAFAEAGLGHGRRAANRLAVAFDAAQVQSFREQNPVGRARLVLTPAEPDDLGRPHRPLLAAYPIGDAFEEGNGDAATDDPGAGPGASWNCAVDAEIADEIDDCLVDWTRRRRFGRLRGERPALSFQEGAGPVVFDVGDHVLAGFSSWIIEPFDRRPWHKSFGYVSREGADELGDLSLAPTLVLTQDLAETGAIAAAAAE